MYTSDCTFLYTSVLMVKDLNSILLHHLVVKHIHCNRLLFA